MIDVIYEGINEGVFWGVCFVMGFLLELVELSCFMYFDWILVLYDIVGLYVYVIVFEVVGYFEFDEVWWMYEGLDVVVCKVVDGMLCFVLMDEDVYGVLEQVLIVELGLELGGCFCVGCSRNDQIVIFVWMYLIDYVCVIVCDLLWVIDVFVVQVEVYFEVILLGWMYLQYVQFVLLVYYLQVYVWFFVWEFECFVDWCCWVGVLLYGGGVLVGLMFGFDLVFVVSEFGFDCLVENLFDGIVVCDVVVEFVFIMVMIGVDLLCLLEEIIFWNICEFGFVIFDDGYFMGLSIMLQKKNLDIVEFMCGKFG